MSTIKNMLLGTLVLLVTACSMDPVRVEQDFGNSVRNMIDAQVYDPDAARGASTEIPAGLDGNKGEKVISTYRNPSQPGKASTAVNIRVSQ